ncbi:MAG: carboxynorspermidine decarboxylase [Deltaproteobacteria bacterium]|nr:carboxynorspermidine decarboxylase [Deltaproteobacteria bacterium]
MKQRKKAIFEQRLRLFLDLLEEVQTPSYVIDEQLIEENMKIMRYVKDRTGCKVLHALKAYASYHTFPMMREYLDGVCASGVNEARLGYDEFKKEVHTFGAAYSEADIKSIVKFSNVVIFNSFTQLEKFAEYVKKQKKQIGIRVNPGYSEVKTKMYDPCAPNSRLGVIREIFEKEYPNYEKIIDGIHFHAMCEQNSDVLQRVLARFIENYGKYLDNVKWVSFGGGHHITREDYDVELLVKLITDFKRSFSVQVYLEPGEASVLDCGYYVTSVLDIVKNGMDIAVVDGSAEAHLPDVLLMPYRPNIIGSFPPYERPYTYRIGGVSCLAGDVIGDYSFEEPLKEKKKLVFTDMAHYTIVKNNCFNGIILPSIFILKKDGSLKLAKSFSFSDFKRRL